MRKLTKFLIFICVLLTVSCSGGSSYNQEECQSLVDKINSKTELNEKDYDQMIDQMVAISDWMEAVKKETGDNEKAYNDSLQTPKARKMGEYVFYFAFEIDKNKDKISSSSARKFNKLMEKNKKEKATK